MKKLIILLCVGSLIASCGWRLRGTLDLPAGLERVHIATHSGNEFTDQLRRMLTANGVTVTDARSDAQLIIRLGQLEEERRVFTTGSNTLVTEYELISELPYAIEDRDGNELQAERTAISQRSYEYDQNDVVGKSAEERLIKQEMQRDLVEQIVRQLRFMDTNTAVEAPEAKQP